MRCSALLIAAAFTGYASAQTSSSSSSSSSSASQTSSGSSTSLTPVPSGTSIDPNSVTESERSQWCLAQRNTCLGICLQNGNNQPTTNLCQQSDLTYACACPSGPSFNMSSYQQSLPAQVCLQWQIQCVNNHPNDFDGIAACHAVTCGNQTIAAQGASTTSTSSSTSPTGDSGSSPSSSSSSSPSPSASHSAAMAARMAENYGLGVFATAILAIVGFAL